MRSIPQHAAPSVQYGGAGWVGMNRSGDPASSESDGGPKAGMGLRALGGGTGEGAQESRLCACGVPVRSRNPSATRCSHCAEAHWRGQIREWKKASRDSGTHCSRCFAKTDAPGCCDRCRAYVSDWKRSKQYREPGKVLRTLGKRKAAGLRAQLLGKQDGKCAYCGESDKVWHLDHVVPVSRGGGHEIANLQVLCAGCNLRKGAKLHGVAL